MPCRPVPASSSEDPFPDAVTYPRQRVAQGLRHEIGIAAPGLDLAVTVELPDHRQALAVVRRRRLTSEHRRESMHYHADRRPMCAPNNTSESIT